MPAKKAPKSPARTKPAKPKAVPDPIAAPSSEPVAPSASEAKRLSILDAAAQVLATAVEPMTPRALVVAMASAGLWKSPAGRTPHQTLASALIREIAAKGAASRFCRPERGRFALAAR